VGWLKKNIVPNIGRKETSIHLRTEIAQQSRKDEKWKNEITIKMIIREVRTDPT